MLTVHHLNASQSERIVWLCEELELPYDLVLHTREPNGVAPPAYKALHPFGTAPVIVDGDVVLGESAAIVEYVCRVHAGDRLMLAPGHPEYVDYLYWFHFANGSLIPAMMMDMFAPKQGGMVSRIDRAFAMIEARLGDATWFSGENFTAADVMMCLTRFAARRDLGGFPNLRAYLLRIAERPGWQRAMAKAEPVFRLQLG